MNKVVLMGRLTREPDVRYSPGDGSVAYARYTLAVDRRMKQEENGDRQTADFITCVAFGKGAEFAEKYLRQGTKIAVVGRIQTGSYTNRDGNKVYTTDVVVEEQEFAESKASQQSGGNAGNQQTSNSNSGRGSGGGQQRNSQQNHRQESFETDSDGFMNIPDGIDEELPFS